MLTTERVRIGLAGALIGVLLIMALGLNAPRTAGGQAAPGHDSGWLMATANATDGRCVCFLFDTRSTMLGVYSQRASQLHLEAIRDCTYDYGVVQYPAKQYPNVAVMKKLSDGGHKKVK